MGRLYVGREKGSERVILVRYRGVSKLGKL